jgi:predicted DNA-binding transcriptional regulator YafY
MVRSWADRELSEAAANALRKIEAVLPPDLEDPGEALYAPNLRPYPVHLVGLLRRAVTERRKARFGYIREDGGSSLRTVWPLGLSYWGAVWTLVAWCELRNDHRNFRLDRMEGLEVLDETFELEPGQTLEDFLRKVRGRVG